jgi:hypothetical protein
MKISGALATHIAAAYKTNLDAGFLFIYSGAVPATADEALDMGAEHTELVKISLNGDGVTGLTFDAAANGVIAKPVAANWSGTIAVDGAEEGDGTVTLTPTFGRFCEAGDNGRGAGTTQDRVQFTVSGPSGSGECILSADTITDNDANVQVLNFARIEQPLQ